MYGACILSHLKSGITDSGFERKHISELQKRTFCILKADIMHRRNPDAIFLHSLAEILVEICE